MSPNVWNVSYTHAAGSSQSAARGASYITNRPEMTREQREAGEEPTRESEWREIEHIGDKDAFIEEANRRRDEKRERAEENGKDLEKDKSPGAAQYMHVVISPENGDRMEDEDFHKLAREWVADQDGGEHPHVGAIHRGDSDHDHMHLLIARDKFSREELDELKEVSEDLAREVEELRAIERDPDREQEREQERVPERSQEPDRDEENDRQPSSQAEAQERNQQRQDREEAREQQMIQIETQE